MPYKLSYFPLRGLAEPIRMMLADNDVDFEDHHVTMEQWPSVKAQYHFGQLPCLNEDDHQIVQSGTIIRHLARQIGLIGENEMDMTYADMFFEGVRDLHKKYAKMIYEAYETEKESFINNILPVELAKFERLLATREGGNHYILGDKISYADYMLFEELDVMLILDPHSLDKFPLLQAFHKRMLERPKLKAYYEKRTAANVPVNGNGKQ